MYEKMIIQQSTAIPPPTQPLDKAAAAKLYPVGSGANAASSFNQTQIAA